MKCPYCSQIHPDELIDCPTTGKKLKSACWNKTCSYYGEYLFPISMQKCPCCGTDLLPSINDKLVPIIQQLNEHNELAIPGIDGMLTTYGLFQKTIFDAILKDNLGTVTFLMEHNQYAEHIRYYIKQYYSLATTGYGPALVEFLINSRCLILEEGNIGSISFIPDPMQWLLSISLDTFSFYEHEEYRNLYYENVHKFEKTLLAINNKSTKAVSYSERNPILRNAAIQIAKETYRIKYGLQNIFKK